MRLSNVFVKTFSRTYCLSEVSSVEEVKLRIEQLEGIASELQSVYHNARRLEGALKGVGTGSTLTVHLALKGGKGGFGAKLKNEGSKKVRSNNNIHSRDLSGRRIKNVNLEKEYIESYKKKLQEDQIVKEEREKFKLRENTLYEEHAFMRLDKNYTAELESGERNIQEAVKKGLMSNWRKNFEIKKSLPNNPEEKQKEEKKELTKGVERLKETEVIKQAESNNQQTIDAEDGSLKRPRPEPEDGEPIIQKELNEQPRKITKVEPTVPTQLDKSTAEKTINELLAKPVESGVSNMSSAALKLKSLFKR